MDGLIPSRCSGRIRESLRTLERHGDDRIRESVNQRPEPEAQAARLREHGCTRVFTDRGVTGRLASRPQWDACRAFLRDGDVLVVIKLDRIGRSVGNLVSVASELRQLGVDLVVLDLIAERTRDGLATARARRGGKLPPRGPSISADKLAAARRLYDRGDMPAPADRRGRRDLPGQLVPGTAARGRATS